MKSFGVFVPITALGATADPPSRDESVMDWNGPKWASSWHNFAPEVTSRLSFPERIEICDWTLEGDGEEMPGIVITKPERVAIARLLDGVGVHRMSAGWITTSFPDEIDQIREVAHLGLKAKVEACTGVDKADLDLAIGTGVSGVFMELPSSDTWIENRQQTRAKVIDLAIECSTYAKEHGLSVTFGLQDSTRADQDFLKQFINSLETQGKVDAICLADSCGVAGPEGFKHLVKMATESAKVPIALHCHNDFGLATANALAGLSAGASIVTTTVNGIGERCGLTPLEEVAMALRILYGIDIGIKFEKLCELSRVVEKATGPVLSPLKPVVGERAFAWETDGFIRDASNLEAARKLKAGLPYEPDLVGNRFRLYPGRRMGTYGVKWEAERLGFKLTDRQAEDLLAKIRDLSRRKQQPSEHEFLSMLRAIRR